MKGVFSLGKRKLIAGMVVGAIVGGLTALLNKEARSYARKKMSTAKGKTYDIVKNPSEAVRSARKRIDALNYKVVNHAEQAINALEQVEETLDKFIKKDT